MNIQLFLMDSEVELNQKFIFPLNQTFENIENPTDIIVDYTKSINIPITISNNRIFGNIYRIDRTILKNDALNLGIFLDPNKKIPMKLMYNQSVLMEGYAKFISSEYTDTQKFYTLNLYGTIGLLFQQLLGCVLNENQLTEDQKSESDGGKKYILDDKLSGQDLTPQLVKQSWENYTPNISEPTLGDDFNIIGYAPGHRGQYGSSFKSDKIESSPGDIMNLSTFVEHIWTNIFINKYESEGKPFEEAKKLAEELVSNLKPSELVSNIRDYEMGDYRIQYLRPYIYINKLFQLYKLKAEEISNYKIELDPTWFNINNPYWSRMCYMFDYLESRGSKNSKDKACFNKFTNGQLHDGYTGIDGDHYFQQFTTTVVGEDLTGMTSPYIYPFSILSTFYAYLHGWGSIILKEHVCINVKMEFFDSVDDNPAHDIKVDTKYFWSQTDPIGVGINADSQIYTADNHVNMFPSAGKSTNPPATSGIPAWRSEVETILLIPGFNIGKNYTFKGRLKMRIVWDMIDNTALPDPSINTSTFYQTALREDRYSGEYKINYIRPAINGDLPDHYNRYSVFTCNTMVGSFGSLYKQLIKLKNMYFKDEPLFNVILQYTKMYGLIWDVDYNNRKINILTRNTYFEKYTISDWSKKLDTNKQFTIQPVVFPDKYICFNYDSVDGNNYKGYKEQYGFEYGEKLLSTNFNFNTEKKKLFDKILPSCSSTKTYLPMAHIINWNPNTILNTKLEFADMLDCSNADDKSAVSMQNWYFRCDGVQIPTDIPTYLTQDTDKLKELKESCWIAPWGIENIFPEDVQTRVYTMPVFNFAIELNNRYFGCLFTAPKEDYTASKNPTKALGNYIFERYWEKYINERYNVQNKKITCYLNISPVDFINFKFYNFIIIGNQMFMINKIIDFDISNPGLTKVELIQITNPQAYATSCDLDF